MTPPPPPHQAFYSAHPTTDATTGKTFNIGIGGAKGSVEVTRLSADGSFEKSASFTPPASFFWHDNTVTEEYVVGVTSPFVAPLKSVLGAMLGFGQIGNAFKWDDTMKSEVCSAINMCLPGMLLHGGNARAQVGVLVVRPSVE